MARIKKTRTICAAPRFHRFSPTDIQSRESVVLTYDEFEVLRLHDLNRLNQEAVALQMQVSRPTVAEMLASAHEKIADALTNGKQILFQHNGCVICEIGKTCPKACSGAECDQKHCCGASCRHKNDGKTN